MAAAGETHTPSSSTTVGNNGGSSSNNNNNNINITTTTTAGGGSGGDFHSAPQFPHHVGPRTWLILAGVNSTGTRLARLALAHGDNVLLGTPPAAFDEVQAAATMGPTGGGGGGAGGFNVPPGQAGLDAPFARPESEQLRQLLLELDDIYAATAAAAAHAAATDADAAMSSSARASSEDDSRSPMSPTAGGPFDPAAAAEAPSAPGPAAGPRPRRLRPVRLDPRSSSQCQAAVATGVAAFGGVDIVVCNSSQVVVGAVEELGASDETLALVRDQFETNFFGNVNAIKAAVPAMRESGRGGHLVVITGITGHLGTPGLGAFCAAGWALEGYCDSIAYEIAPFNIKVSIVQPMFETAVLPNPIKAAPALPQYAPGAHPAPLSRTVIGGLLDRIHGTEQQQQHSHDERRGSAATDQTSGSDDVRSASRTLGSSTSISTHEPSLPPELLDGLIQETLFSVCAIAGHPNPPQRHIVGVEGVISVKEKLKNVSTELEDLVQASTAVDVTGEGEHHVA